MPSNRRRTLTETLMGLVIVGCSAIASSQGTINFQGHIVASGCETRKNHTAGFYLSICPTISPPTLASVAVLSAPHAHERPETNLQLFVERRHYRNHYDQRYTILDSSDKPVSSGHYLVTLTWP